MVRACRNSAKSLFRCSATSYCHDSAAKFIVHFVDFKVSKGSGSEFRISEFRGFLDERNERTES